MWPYPWTHAGTPSNLGHLDLVAATLPSQVTCGSGSRGTSHRALGGTGRPQGRTFFLHCQRRNPELPMIPTYLPPIQGHKPSGPEKNRKSH